VTTPAWMADLPDGVFAAATERLREAVRSDGCIVVAAHVSPDGDALGGTLALHLALARLGARSIPTVGEAPLKVPAALADLPGVDALLPPGALPRPDEVDLLITVDAASPERLGRVSGYLDAGVPTVVLDHHAASTRFGDLRVIAPNAAATVQVVAAVLDELGVDLDGDIATCLYAGLVTDTGRFGFASTDRAVMDLAGALIDAGARHADLTEKLFNTRSFGELKLLAGALHRMAFVPEVALVHTHVTHQELADVGLGLEAVEAVIDVVRSADLAEVALVLKPAPDGVWKGSLRSRRHVDVGEVAAALGGGGHARAAGFTAHGDPEEIVARVVGLLGGPSDGT
jgi:bifunctional oligoribonuclease and PAP phosphatase NrnA